MENKKCLKCSSINKPEANFCRICGIEIKSDDTFVRTNEKIETGERTSEYPALKTTSFLYLISAWLVGLGAIIALIYGLTQLGSVLTRPIGFIIIASSLLIGFLGAISLLSLSEGIKLFIAIEKNTRNK